MELTPNSEGRFYSIRILNTRNHNSAVTLARKVAESWKVSPATRGGIAVAIVVEVNSMGARTISESLPTATDRKWFL